MPKTFFSCKNCGYTVVLELGRYSYYRCPKCFGPMQPRWKKKADGDWVEVLKKIRGKQDILNRPHR